LLLLLLLLLLPLLLLPLLLLVPDDLNALSKVDLKRAARLSSFPLFALAVFGLKLPPPDPSDEVRGLAED